MSLSDIFYDQVYEIARLVRKGRVTTYGAIAKALVAAKSPILHVYAHCVVNRNGLLTGMHHYARPQKCRILIRCSGTRCRNCDFISNVKV